jgi:hypothetical protein
MAQSSRQRRKARKRSLAQAAPGPPAESRTEAKNREARESLEPLAAGERPTAVTIGAVAAVLIGVGNVVLGYTETGSVSQALPLSILLLVAAAGMWANRAWAVLGLMVVLIFFIVVLSLDLFMVAQGWVILADVAQIAAYGTLFFFLIKALGRIQMPERR